MEFVFHIALRPGANISFSVVFDREAIFALVVWALLVSGTLTAVTLGEELRDIIRTAGSWQHLVASWFVVEPRVFTCPGNTGDPFSPN